MVTPPSNGPAMPSAESSPVRPSELGAGRVGQALRRRCDPQAEAADEAGEGQETDETGRERRNSAPGTHRRSQGGAVGAPFALLPASRPRPSCDRQYPANNPQPRYSSNRSPLENGFGFRRCSMSCTRVSITSSNSVLVST